MDIVYVYARGNNKEVEMRHSLMFLGNMPHNRVFVVGDCPLFSRNIIHINHRADPDNKGKNVADKLRLIVENNDISDDFILMNDDIYAINPIEDYTPYIRGKLRPHLKRVFEKYGGSKYYKSLNKVLYNFPDAINYDTHTPFVYNKEKLKYILENYRKQGSIRSIYGNYYKLEGRYLPNYNDCKIYNYRELTLQMLDFPYISTDNGVTWNDNMWRIIRTKLNKLPNVKKKKYID